MDPFGGSTPLKLEHKTKRKMWGLIDGEFNKERSDRIFMLKVKGDSGRQLYRTPGE